ncbi:BolA family protein [Geminicoccus roseus]|uniref:BolA family protein n=1 Tax=Geminicoccus roseus TaxID=404900 RepID=UPI000422E444|nr:BolA family protein [Geminicoccus roseus]
MRMTDRIRAALAPLEPLALQVDDRSADHRGHGGWREGGETHFDVMIVSASFRGQSRIARHRAVNALLAPLMEERIHALALRALTPEEAGSPQAS